MFSITLHYNSRYNEESLMLHVGKTLRRFQLYRSHTAATCYFLLFVPYTSSDTYAGNHNTAPKHNPAGKVAHCIRSNWSCKSGRVRVGSFVVKFVHSSDDEIVGGICCRTVQQLSVYGHCLLGSWVVRGGESCAVQEHGFSDLVTGAEVLCAVDTDPKLI